MLKKYKFKFDAKIIDITVSLGIYNCCIKDKNFYNSIKFADEALYMSKSLGRNKVICYDEIIG